jgi:hypothetical protein
MISDTRVSDAQNVIRTFRTLKRFIVTRFDPYNIIPDGGKP